MLKIKPRFFVLLLQLLTLTFSDDSSSCVDNYLDFEEQTFGNNSENRLKLYEAFYPPNDHLPYSVVVTYQAVLPNGTRVNITTDSSCHNRQVWLWLSSPILLLTEPTELNRLTLYTLNHFTEWVPPHLIITTPLPCSDKTEGFLTLMTSSVSGRRILQIVSHKHKTPLSAVHYSSHCYYSLSTQLQTYALEEMSNGEHLGYSSQGCTTNTAIVSLIDESSNFHIYRIFGAVGFTFLVIFQSMAYAVLLQVLFESLSQKMDTCSYSFDYYGIFWGMSAIFCLFLIVILCRATTHMSLVTFNPGIQQAEHIRYFWPVNQAFSMIMCAPVAIYFGIKFRFATPSVYLLPAKLLCCCSEKRAGILVTSLTLWCDLVAAHYFVGIGTFVLYAFPVAPFVVAVNVMLLVLTLMCLTYIMALVFTICASLGTRKCLRSNADCCATVRAAMLIPLLLAIICFSSTFALSSQLVNTSTQQNSFHMFLKSLFAPVLLAVLGLGLKRFISVWMHWSPADVDGDIAVNPLHGHVYDGYQAIDNVVLNLMH